MWFHFIGKLGDLGSFFFHKNHFIVSKLYIFQFKNCKTISDSFWVLSFRLQLGSSLSLFHLISLCGGVALFNGVCRGFITYCPSKEFFFLIELKGVNFFYWFKCKMINDTVIKKLSFFRGLWVGVGWYSSLNYIFLKNSDSNEDALRYTTEIWICFR
jgi:hypothetical protein